MNPANPPNPPADNPDLQGEGNYDATRRYDKAQHEFVEAGKVDEAARHARPENAKEADEMERAERSGRSHSKGEDPAITNPAPVPKTPKTRAPRTKK